MDLTFFDTGEILSDLQLVMLEAIPIVLSGS
jgi:hypothetical protein